MVRCVLEFTPSCLQLYNMSLAIPAKCYTVGTYSRCLREWEYPIGELEGYFHEVKVNYTNRGAKKEGEEEREEVIFFLRQSSHSFLGSGPIVMGRRWLVLDYTTKGGREILISKNQGSTRAADKWQGYLPGNYRFPWSQVWNPLRAGKEAAFIWSIWHKAVVVNEWRTRMASVSISKQCIFLFSQH